MPLLRIVAEDGIRLANLTVVQRIFVRLAVGKSLSKIVALVCESFGFMQRFEDVLNVIALEEINSAIKYKKVVRKTVSYRRLTLRRIRIY